jgi:hypothetical protein
MSLTGNTRRICLTGPVFELSFLLSLVYTSDTGNWDSTNSLTYGSNGTALRVKEATLNVEPPDLRQHCEQWLLLIYCRSITMILNLAPVT